MKRAVLLLLCLTVFFAAPAFARDSSADERTELWEGSIFTSKFRCGFCFNRNGKARGVLLLKTAFGQVDEYHLYGTIRGDRISMRHSSGHDIKGTIVSPTRVKGSIKLGSGGTYSFKGKRTTDVRLAPSDCAPLGSW